MQTQILQISEDLFPTLNTIRDNISSQGFVYGWMANVETKYDQGHWNKRLLNNSKFFPYDHGSMPYLEKRYKLVNRIWKDIQSQIGQRNLLRAYVNGYTYGTDGYVHRDDRWISNRFGEDALSETIIVYMNKVWDCDWAGETVILDNQREIEKSVLPKFGRVLVFNSNKEHAARPVSRACTALRQVLVFKTIDDRAISREVDFIQKKTKDIPHSGRSFFEHLFDTCLKLERMGCSRDVCVAGLYHSVYGTEFYSFNDTDINREVVRELIGDYAESLVYEFCSTSNRHETLLHNLKNYDTSFLIDMINIEIANLSDQNGSQQYDVQIGALINKRDCLIVG